MRVITLRDLMEKIGIKRSTIYQWLDKDHMAHDPKFPRPIKVGKQKLGWIEDEVDDWIRARIRA